jgi:spore germination protein KC
MRITSLRRRAVLLAAAWPFLALLLTGCWDRTELNDMAFAMSSAVDKEQDGSYRVSYLLPLPGQMGGPSGGGGGTAGGQESYYIDSETGRSMREAGYKLQQRMSRKLFLSHRRTVLIGEEAAREGIGELLDTIPRLPETRLSTYFVVTKGPAWKLLNTKPKFERFPAEAIRELAKAHDKIAGNAKDVALALSFGGDPVIVYMGEKKSEKTDNSSREVEVIGFAQFKHEKMVGVYDKRLTQGLMWLRQGVQTYTITVESPEDHKAVALDVRSGNSRITPMLEGDDVTINVDLEAKATVRENYSKLDMNHTEDLRVVEKAVSDQITAAVKDTIQAMQKNRTDSAQIGNIVWRRYPAEWKGKLESNWDERFAKAKFNVQVRTNITEVGLINQNVTRRSY